MDNATFFHNLPPDLRRAILSDMDDSLINHLPEDMMAEARVLRQERDSRRRQMLEHRHAILERMMDDAHLRLPHSGGSGGGGGRRDTDLFPPSSWPQMSAQGMRYAVVNVNPHMLDGPILRGIHPGGGVYNFSGRGGSGGGSGTLSIHHTSKAFPDQNSKQMLDQEALACLLVLLFLDQTKLHNNRLHRIIRNLSQHSPTRAWILSSLLTIIKEMRKLPSSSSFSGHMTTSLSSPAAMGTLSSTCPMPPPLTSSGMGASSAFDMSMVACAPMGSAPQPQCMTPHWLDMGINAALGSHAKIFQFVSDSHGGKSSTASVGSSTSSSSDVGATCKVNIHPLAGTAICNNILDLLIFLGRHFGSSFLPSDLLPRPGGGGDKTSTLSATGEGEEQRKKEEGLGGEAIVTNFWQILMKLDSAAGRKGKGSLKGFKYSDSKGVVTDQVLFSNSILGQLMGLFSHDIIKDNLALVDKLLRTLSITSSSIPRTGMRSISRSKDSTKPASGLSEAIPATTLGASPSSGTGISEKPTEPGDGSAADEVKEKVLDATELSMVTPPLLGNVISVLISGRCTEEGLEEATALLTNLSKCSISTREHILFMLLDGVKTIGRTLCYQITGLYDCVAAGLQEDQLEKGLAAYDQQDEVMSKNSRKKMKIGKSASPLSSAGPSNVLAGVVLPSTGTEEQHIDHSHDLHIPAMEPLTCKGSQQSFFVRMLKVVCHLRESAQQAIVSVSKSSGTAAATTTTSADASDATTSANASDNTNASDVIPTASSNASETTITMILTSTPSHAPVEDGVMSTGSDLQQHKPEAVLSLLGDSLESPPSFLQQTLSLQLELEELWVILSDCLDALSHTEDPHAVFVLQPTVEAFFLVHANFEGAGSDGKKRANEIMRVRSSATSLNDERSLSSPAPFSPLPGTPGHGDREFDLFAHLPPDTARFLKFAGM